MNWSQQTIYQAKGSGEEGGQVIKDDSGGDVKLWLQEVQQLHS